MMQWIHCSGRRHKAYSFRLLLKCKRENMAQIPSKCIRADSLREEVVVRLKFVGKINQQIAEKFAFSLKKLKKAFQK